VKKSTCLKILIVDDHRQLLESFIALLERAAPLVEWQPIIAESYQEARTKWGQNKDIQVAVLDLKMPNESGEESLESGFALLSEFAPRPGSRVVIHSGFTDPLLQERARLLGASRYYSKDDAPAEKLTGLTKIGQDVAVWLTEHPVHNSAAPSLDASNEAAEARHAADRAWFLSNTTLWPERQQQIVAVFDRTILGQGPDFIEAYEAAQQQCAAQSKPCPDQYDLTFIIVPDVVDPEPAADWDPLASTAT